MRLSLASRFAWPRIGGVEMLVRELGGALAERGVDVGIFAHRVDDGDVEWIGVLDRAASFPPMVDAANGIVTSQLRLHEPEALALKLAYAAGASLGDRVIPFERLHSALASRSFSRQLSGSDVVHRFGGNRIGRATIEAARRLDVPAVVTPLAHPGQWDADRISANGYQQASLVVATSRADAETYERLGVSPGRIGICPLPTSAFYAGGGAQLRTKWQIEGPLVLFLGGRRPYKGVDELVRAARLLANKCPQARVAFVGPGPSISAPGSTVLDVGPVDDAQRDAWLDAADVLCLPSSAESFGLVVSEAWSAGVPVVTSNIPVLKERLAASGGGIAVSPIPAELADAIGCLLSDPQLRVRMGEAGYQHWKENCSPESVAAWHEQQYARLLH